MSSYGRSGVNTDKSSEIQRDFRIKTDTALQLLDSVPHRCRLRRAHNKADVLPSYIFRFPKSVKNIIRHIYTILVNRHGLELIRIGRGSAFKYEARGIIFNCVSVVEQLKNRLSLLCSLSVKTYLGRVTQAPPLCTPAPQCCNHEYATATWRNA